MLLVSNSTEETKEIGRRIANAVKSGDIISLTGSLGAGKTVLTKGIAEELGITEAIVSPTFTLVQEYDEGRLYLSHLDLYRLSGEDEFESMGGEDFLYQDGLTIIEWSEKIASLLPKKTIYITITINEDLSRNIDIKGLEI